MPPDTREGDKCRQVPPTEARGALIDGQQRFRLVKLVGLSRSGKTWAYPTAANRRLLFFARAITFKHDDFRAF